MLHINKHIQIDLNEFTWSYTTSRGPGGQNVNKVATQAELRWSVEESPSLPEEVKERLLVQQRSRINKLGELVLTSDRYRSQGRNRDDCLEKLQEMIRRATIVPKVRKKKKPSRRSKERRLANKRHRSSVKSSRRSPSMGD